MRVKVRILLTAGMTTCLATSACLVLAPSLSKTEATRPIRAAGVTARAQVAAVTPPLTCDDDGGFGVGTGPYPKFDPRPITALQTRARLAAARTINTREYGNTHFGCARLDGHVVRVSLVAMKSTEAKELRRTIGYLVPRGIPIRYSSAKYASVDVAETRASMTLQWRRLTRLGANSLTGWYDGQSLHISLAPSTSHADEQTLRSMYPEPFVVLDRTTKGAR